MPTNFKVTSPPLAPSGPDALAEILGGDAHFHVFFPMPWPGEGRPLPMNTDTFAYPKIIPIGESSISGKGKKRHNHVVSAILQLEPVMAPVPGNDPNAPPEPTLVAFQERLVGYQIGDNAGDHLHAPGGDIPQKAFDDRSADEERADEMFGRVYQARKDAIDYNATSYEVAREVDKFVHGEQWGSIGESGVPPAPADETPRLTFNHAQAILNTLSGVQRNQATQPKFFPVEGGDERVADILDVVAKDFLEQNDYNLEASAWFEDMASVGIGIMHMTTEVTPDLKQEVRLKRVDWNDVHLGPHRDVRALDMLHAHLDETVTKRELMLRFPDWADEIEKFFVEGESMATGGNPVGSNGEIYITGAKIPVSTFRTMAGMSPGGGGDKTQKKVPPDLRVVDFTAKTIRLVTTYFKEYRAVPVAVAYGETINLLGAAPDMLRAIKSIPEIVVIDVPQNVIRRVEWAGTLILSDRIQTLTGPHIPLGVGYCRKTRDRFYGKITPLVDISRYYNKLTSLMIDAATRSAHGAVHYDGNTFDGSAVLLDRYETERSKPGAMLQIADTARPPMPVETPAFPFDLAQGRQEILNEMRQIANVNPEMLGITAFSREGSGASRDRVNQALQGNEFLFDNFKYSKRHLYKMLVFAIQEIYRDNPQDMLRILGTQSARGEVAIGADKFGRGEQIPPEMMAALEQLVRTTDLTKHDVICEESSQSPTIRLQTFQNMVELVRNGAMQMTPQIMDLAPIPRDMKDSIKQGLAESQQSQKDIAELPYKTEILKTQIKANSQGKGGEPPVPGAGAGPEQQGMSPIA